MSADERPGPHRGAARRDGDAPGTQTLETLRDRLPLSIRLIGRSSRAGAVLVLAIAVVFIGLVPLAAKLQLNASQATGERIAVGDAMTLTVANDWTVASQDGRATVLTSGSSQLVIVPAYEESLAPLALVSAEISTVDDDGSAAWVTGDASTFSTRQGAPGAVVSASGDTTAIQVWAVASGGLATVARLTTTIESWSTVQAQVQQMIESLEFEEAPGDDGAAAGTQP